MGDELLNLILHRAHKALLSLKHSLVTSPLPIDIDLIGLVSRLDIIADV